MSGPLILPHAVGLALVGYRGTGKSTVGRMMGRALGRPFVDADEALEARLGRSIRSVWENEGEPAFRDREEALLAEIASQPDRKVLATGGGVVIRESNRNVLKRFGHVIWLRADPSVLADRLRDDARRPPLTSAGTLSEIAAVLAFREPLYRAVADTVIETDGLDPRGVALQIFQALQAISSA